MGSITYLINMHAGAIFFISAGLIAAVLVGALVLNIWLEKKLKLTAGVSKALLVAVFFVGLAAILLGVSVLRSTSDMGGVRRIFVLPVDNGWRLAVWCTRIYAKRSGVDYEQYMRTFDLATGKIRGSVRLAQKHFDDDYRLYWSGGNKAWGYREGAGIMLIDMSIPEIIADNEGLQKHNPDLSGGIFFKAYRDTVDPHRTGLYVGTAGGRIFKLENDLSARQAVQVPAGADLKREWKFVADWYFSQLTGSKGRHAHARGATCDAARSAVLLEPEYLPELNFGIAKKKKTWVVHKSALLGDYDLLLSYMGADGVACNTINASRLFSRDDLNILATYTFEKHILIFIGAGKTFRSNILGFALSALQTDPETGALTNRIDFF